MSKERTRSQRLSNASELLATALHDLKCALLEQETVQAEYEALVTPLFCKLKTVDEKVVRAEEQFAIAMRRLEGSL